ncbi:hypothetical protein DSBG_4008 [Desulfosporosinus sp. BG]|nr:hypothetical protein DSBG_4008 [Desulfosporosinus sp. BG]
MLYSWLHNLIMQSFFCLIANVLENMERILQDETQAIWII